MQLANDSVKLELDMKSAAGDQADARPHATLHQVPDSERPPLVLRPHCSARVNPKPALRRAAASRTYMASAQVSVELGQRGKSPQKKRHGCASRDREHLQ